MNSLRKILVVDSGRREEFDSLSHELAGMGMSSVTASFEAAAEVLDLIDRPSAIFVKMPHNRESAGYEEMAGIAADLKRRESALGIPVIVWDGIAFNNETPTGTVTSGFGRLTMDGSGR